MRAPRTAGIWILMGMAGCRTTAVGPYTTLEEVSRSTIEAEALNRRAADLIVAEPGEAEQLLREALTKDIFYGPAHNNLGVVLLQRGKLYDAANEFEWARKLLPESPDPRINLALVMEQAGRRVDALRAYEAALEVAPECIAAMQGAASLSVRMSRDDSRLQAWLERIALEGCDALWMAWARDQRSLRGG